MRNLKVDSHLLVEKIKKNMNGKRIYDVVLAIDGEEDLAELVAQGLEIEVTKETEHHSPFVLVVEKFYNAETRKKYWDYDYAVLDKLAEDEQPTYCLDGTEEIEGQFITRVGKSFQEDIVYNLLKSLGEDPDREGLQDTPKRVIKFYKEFFSPSEFNFTVFDSEEYDEMIVQRDIPFFSLCEHHMAPFFGKATVAYIPNGKIVGLSKLARCVEHYARKLQNQERITAQVAERLQEELNPLGVGVFLEARHFCMEMRGVRTHDVTTATSKLIGAIKDEPEARAEFLSLAGK